MFCVRRQKTETEKNTKWTKKNRLAFMFGVRLMTLLTRENLNFIRESRPRFPFSRSFFNLRAFRFRKNWSLSVMWSPYGVLCVQCLFTTNWTFPCLICAIFCCIVIIEYSIFSGKIYFFLSCHRLYSLT